MENATYGVQNMVTKSLLLSELAHRVEAARSNGDLMAVELYAATWHRVNAEPDDLSVSGLRRRLARRDAAALATVPLDARIHAEDLPRKGEWA
jgi:hypothetical protein